MRSRRCTDSVRAGRLAKARQFHRAAELLKDVVSEGDVVDARVTLCIHAGIAAADAICCLKLGEHSAGEDHGAAVTLLANADKVSARYLKTLLALKTQAGYGANPVSRTDQARAERAAAALLRAAEAADAGAKRS
jgi:hypothetical protein